MLIAFCLSALLLPTPASALAQGQPIQDRVIEIEGRVQLGRTPSAPLVPHIPLELGACLTGDWAWILDPLSEPLRLGEVVSDSEGRFRTTLTIPKEYLAQHKDPVGLYAKQMSPHLQQTASMQAVPGDLVGAFEMIVVVQEGSTIRGKVVDQYENPVEGASVSFFRSGHTKSIGQSNHTDAQGIFEFHFKEPELYDIIVKKDGIGTASLLDQPYGFKADQPQLKLQLKGEGFLAGRVVNPSGDPIPGYKVTAEKVAEKQVFTGQSPGSPMRIQEGLGLGNNRGYASTDQEGRFRIEGLRPGNYALKGLRGNNYTYITDLVESPVPTGTDDLEITRRTRMLLLQVVDHEGNVVHPISTAPRNEWTETHAFIIEECNADGKAATSSYSYSDIPRALLDTGEIVAFLMPNQPYVYGIVSAREPFVHDTLTVDHHEWTARRTIQLGPPAPLLVFPCKRLPSEMESG